MVFGAAVVDELIEELDVLSAAEDFYIRRSLLFFLSIDASLEISKRVLKI